MRPEDDAANQIACSSCARAKAKCDKRLPACSRCVKKALKCELRPPRRYRVGVPTHNTSLRASTGHQSPRGTNVNMFLRTPPQGFSEVPYSNALQWLPENLTVPSRLDIQDKSDLGETPQDTSLEVGVAAQTESFQPQRWAKQISISHESELEHESITNVQPTVLEDWPWVQCNPQHGSIVRAGVGRDYLRQLEDTLNGQTSWDSSEYASISNPELFPYIEPVHENVRDRLAVISQSFFTRARNSHGTASGLARDEGVASTNLHGFFILPPPRVLDAFLQTFALRVEALFPFFPSASFSPSMLIASIEIKPSALLLLIMIAYGAMGTESDEARCLANGLLETCRLCMFDTLNKEVQLAEQPIMLRCSLLYLSAAAFSGTRWHMDLGAAHLRAFIFMCRSARIFEFRSSTLDHLSSDIEMRWRTWQREESSNRIAYAWVMLDQEVHLFQDRQPELDISELNATVPLPDSLWNHNTAQAWYQQYDSYNQSHQNHSRSLSTLFQNLMNEKLINDSAVLTAIELRLLLHPIQTMIFHVNRSLIYLSQAGHRSVHRLIGQLEDTQYMLRQWYALAVRVIKLEETLSPQDCCTMVIMHVISLNAFIFFPDIERLARGELDLQHFLDTPWMGKRYTSDAAQILVHCGQVIRLYRQMPSPGRPFWWSAALYRAALCMWATAIAMMANPSNVLRSTDNNPHVGIDLLSFDDPAILRYMRQQDALPILSRQGGTSVTIRQPIAVVAHCNSVLLEKGPLSQLDQGISARLSAMVQHWEGR